MALWLVREVQTFQYPSSDRVHRNMANLLIPTVMGNFQYPSSDRVHRNTACRSTASHASQSFSILLRIVFIETARAEACKVAPGSIAGPLRPSFGNLRTRAKLQPRPCAPRFSLPSQTRILPR